MRETMSADMTPNINITADRPRGLWLKRIVAIILPIAIVAAAIIGVIVMGAMKPKPEEKEDTVRALPVLTASVTQRSVMLTANSQGEVQPRTQINLVPQVSGRITFMSPRFIEGASFNKGDVLFRIDPRDYQLRVTQAEANVAQAQTALTREQSEAAIAAKDWQELQSGQAPSDLTLRKPQLAEVHARLDAAKAQLEEAKLQLSRTSIYAPFSGRVVTRKVNKGEYVTLGTALGEIYDSAIMDVRLPLTQSDMAKTGLGPGYEARGTDKGRPVTLSALIGGQSASWTGHIVRTDARFDPKSRQLFAYAEVKDPFGSGDMPLAPGLFVDAAIDGQSHSQSLTIPRAALRGKDRVYVADEETLRIKTVTVISSNREEAFLSSGLSLSDKVITSPIRGVADGMTINPVTTLSDTDSEGE